MVKSTPSAVARQATAARPKGFPLFAHQTGRWAKKIRGKLVYFGKLDDPQAALAKWLEQKDDLLAGRTPRVNSDGLTVRDLVNRFLSAKKNRLDTGELSARSFSDYYATCGRVVNCFGRNRLVVDLAADDFERLRTELAAGRSPTTLANDVQRVRVLFKFAYDAHLIDRPVRYGPDFRKPSARTMRHHRHAKGLRMFEAADLRRIIEAAGQPLKAMSLLGVNCGFGNADVATLPTSAVNLETGWADFPRPKTGIGRRCWLWPETIDAIREWMTERPMAKDRDDEVLLFVTKYGAGWSNADTVKIEEGNVRGEYTVKGDRSNPVSAEFAKLLRTLKLHRPGLGFYALRHTFETIAGESRDQVAVNAIMGHTPAANDMASVYRERISDERLRAVAEHVRKWLWPKSQAKIGKSKPRRAPRKPR